MYYSGLRDNYEIRELLEKEWISQFQENRDEIRDHAKENIAKIQKENKRGFDKKRKEGNKLLRKRCSGN